MTNPFEIIEARLNNIESMLFDLKHGVKQTPTKQPENLTIEQAIEFLKENGLPIAKAQVYKLSFQNEIPASRIGKRLVFSRKDLLNWLEMRTIEKVSPQRKAAEKLAKSANRRERASL